MITELTEEQKARMPDYVDKWTKIGLSTDPTNLPAAIQRIKEIYKIAKLAEPKYFFHFSSPKASVHAICMVEVLTNFSDSYQDKTIHRDMSPYSHIFESLYKQYSTQYKEPDVVWNEDTKQRMWSFISKAYTLPNLETELANHLGNMLFNCHNAAWLAFYDFFHKEFDLEVVRDLIPAFQLAEECGWWSPYEEAVFIQDRPSSIHMNSLNVLHNTEGPAIEYPDGQKYYYIESHLFPEKVVMDPDKITVHEIDEEQNAEKRRILLERYGYQRYFDSATCKLIDSDEVVVSNNDDRTMPRMLIETKHGDVYLVGTDGSTKRTYFMNIGSKDSISRIESRFGPIKTCKAAHELISGLDESKCVTQS